MGGSGQGYLSIERREGGGVGWGEGREGTWVLPPPTPPPPAYFALSLSLSLPFSPHPSTPPPPPPFHFRTRSSTLARNGSQVMAKISNLNKQNEKPFPLSYPPLVRQCTDAIRVLQYHSKRVTITYKRPLNDAAILQLLNAVVHESFTTQQKPAGPVCTTR